MHSGLKRIFSGLFKIVQIGREIEFPYLTCKVTRMGVARSQAGSYSKCQPCLASIELLLPPREAPSSVHAAWRDTRVSPSPRRKRLTDLHDTYPRAGQIMSKTPPTAGQTIYRLSVMVGTLSIGSMAAYLYGPPPEKLASLINTAANSFAEMAEHRNSAPTVVAGASNLTEAPASGLVAGSVFGTNEALSSTPINSQSIARSVVAPIEPAELLRQAGATESSVTPWGAANPTTGQSLYRAAATIPVNGPNNGSLNGPAGGQMVSTGMVERLDAIGETPEKAVEALLAQMNRIRR